MNHNKRLYRSQNALIAGICAGIAEHFGWDTAATRLAMLLLILVGGLSVWVYVILWLILPKAPNRLNP